MDKKISLEASSRYGLNSTHMASPIAESTGVSLSNSTCSGSQFHWGGTPISPNHRSSSSSKILATATTAKGLRHLSSRLIDARVYVDVQSKGLTSRIVKYHEQGKRLSRSMSANSLYTKPGQFPVVHLKKTELPYKATKQPLSMTRIAPPEKSMYYGNTLSSLLRSNSVLGLQKHDDELSHENRPILHPPPNENELAPTRSVLDVLKEISRKRINSDAIDQVDTNKKYCSYGESCSSMCGVDNVPTSATVNYKRQREPPNCSVDTTVFVLANNSSPLAPGAAHLQLSPQQTAKKRLCSYNNDVSSSLSSSTYNASRRKINKQQQCYSNYSNALNGSPDNPIEVSHDEELPKGKIQQKPQQLTLTKSSSSNIGKPTEGVIAASDAISQARFSSPFEPAITSVHLAPPVVAQATSKPKLTLFNKKYEDTGEETSLLQPLARSAVEPGDYLDIQYVRPKKDASVSTKKNPLIERTQRSKLALMLCGLRGELYLSDQEDEIDNGPAPQLVAQDASNSSITQTSTMPTVVSIPAAAITTQPAVTLLEQAPPVAVASVIQTPAKTIAMTVSAPVSITTNITTIPVLSGFTFNTSTSPAKEKIIALPMLPTLADPSAAAPQPSTPSHITAAPTSILKAPLTTGNNAAASDTAIGAPTTLTGTTAGALTLAFGSTETSNSLKTTFMPTFGSSVSASAIATTTAATTTNSVSVQRFAPSVTSALTFGVVPTTAAAPVMKAAPMLAAAPTVTSPPSFTFGTVAPSAQKSTFSFGTAMPNSSSSSTLPKPSAEASSFAFGSSATLIAGSSNADFTSGIKPTDAITVTGSASFMFGAQASNHTPSAVAAPVFGSIPSAQTADAPTFLFGATPTGKTVAEPQTQAAAHLFGGAANNHKQPFSFGSGNEKSQSTPEVSTFNFASGTTATGTSAANLFGAAVKPNFSFGGAAPNCADKTLFNSTNSNTTTTTSINSFGSLAAANDNKNNATVAQQYNGFTFGTTPTAANKNNFTKSTSNSSPGAAAFTFGGSISAAIGTGKPTGIAAPSSSFAFGDSIVTSALSNNVNNSNASFKFGSAAPSAKNFTFGGVGQNVMPASANIFTNAAKPAFNYAAPPMSAAGVGVGNVAAGGNMFAAQQGDRVIRKATRRLQKS